MSSKLIFEVITWLLNPIISLIIDIVIFFNILGINKKWQDKLFIIIFIVTFFVLSISTKFDMLGNTEITILEMLLVFLYYCIVKKENYQSVISIALVFGISDTMVVIVDQLIQNSFLFIAKNNLDFALDIFMNILSYFFIMKNIVMIKKHIYGENSKIFMGVLIYVYLCEAILSNYVLSNDRPEKIVQISLIVLILQSVFAFLVYFELTKVQDKLLEKREQENLKKEKLQLEEYATYLDKNEDELRRFKHDYKNILNSLKIDADSGDVKGVIEKLDKYTSTELDDNILRRYKGLNHVYIKSLKSIALAKLTKLYNSGIKYSFDCEPVIRSIPSNVDLLDISRIIGIAFDNAAEAVMNIDRRNILVEAMYYQEQGDFEFEIRNYVESKKIEIGKISQAGFTTKSDHLGLGLSNVEKLVQKYDNVFVDYKLEDNWFTFNLIIMPEEK